MRVMYGQATLGLSIVFVVVGTASAAPAYTPGLAAVPGFEPEPLVSETPQDALWRHMVNATAEGLDVIGDLRGTAPGPIVTTFTSSGLYDAAVGPHELITFTEPVVGEGDVLYDQYDPVGVLFLDGAVQGDGDDDVVLVDSGFLKDGVGVHANGSVEIEFSVPQTHLAVDAPGALQIALFQGSDPTPFWTSNVGDFATSGLGKFAGVVVSGDTFDRAIISDPIDGFAFIDDLHYDVLPEPGAIILLGTGWVVLVRCRRGKRKLR